MPNHLQPLVMAQKLAWVGCIGSRSAPGKVLGEAEAEAGGGEVEQKQPSVRATDEAGMRRRMRWCGLRLS